MSTQITEIKEELSSYYKEYMNLNIQRCTGQLVKPHLLRQVRRNIARAKTKLHMLEARRNDD